VHFILSLIFGNYISIHRKKTDYECILAAVCDGQRKQIPQHSQPSAIAETFERISNQAKCLDYSGPFGFIAGFIIE